MTSQCPNCQRWFTNLRSLRLHIQSCRPTHFAKDDTHCQIDHHLLRSSHYTDNVTAFNDERYSERDNNDYKDDPSDIDDLFPAESRVCSDDYDNVDRFLNDYKEAQGQQSTAASKVQTKLNHLINSHKAPLKLYDDIFGLFNEYMSSDNFDRYDRFKCRKSFIKANEGIYRVSHLWPNNLDVVLTDGAKVTVPVFDAKSMILDLLTNPGTMNGRNIAVGYDVFTGNVDETALENKCYGEVHTGDQWLPARDRYCTNKDQMDNEMPVALIIFGEKSHTDLHGSLSLTPIIFILTLFNQPARNNTKFWRPLVYIPNLSYGKNKADKRDTRDKIQDEHRCLSIAMHSIKEIHRMGEFYATVMGRAVKIKVWIHYFIGDTEGDNKWLGHYPGNKKEISRPYCDCCCGYLDLNNPNPSCIYTTLDDMREAKRVKRNNDKEGKSLLKSMS